MRIVRWVMCACEGQGLGVGDHCLDSEMLLSHGEELLERVCGTRLVILVSYSSSQRPTGWVFHDAFAYFSAALCMEKNSPHGSVGKLSLALRVLEYIRAVCVYMGRRFCFILRIAGSSRCSPGWARLLGKVQET